MHVRTAFYVSDMRTIKLNDDVLY